MVFSSPFFFWAADSYNGLAGLGDYSGYSFTQLVMLTYEKFINFFLSPELFISYRFHNRSLSVVWYWILFVTNLAILFYIPAGVLSENLMLPDKKDKILRMIMQTVCFIILPFAMNGICIVYPCAIPSIHYYSTANGFHQFLTVIKFKVVVFSFSFTFYSANLYHL